MEYYSAMRKNGILPFVKILMDVQWNVPEKNKYFMISLICGVKKKKRVEKWSTGAREWRNRERFMKGYQGNSLPVQRLGSVLSLSYTWVQSLVLEIRSHKPHGVTKKEGREMVTNFNSKKNKVWRSNVKPSHCSR